MDSTSVENTPSGSQHPRAAATQLFTELREDWIANGRDWTTPGFRALAVNRFARRVRATSSSRLFRAPFALLYRSMFRFCRNIYGVELGYTAEIGRRLAIHHHMGLAIHPNVTMGDDCIVRQGVTIGVLRPTENMAVPTLGDRVDVGAGATILGAINIGDDAVIGANAVVVRDVPAGWAALGNPARVIRLNPGS